MTKPMAVTKKNYAMIQIWRKGGGYNPAARPTEETYEAVMWFEDLPTARKYYRTISQGQTSMDGECNRLLVEVIDRLK